MLSLSEAKSRFFEATAVDRLLLEEHERLLGQSVVAAINQCEKSVQYEVPWMLPGPYPPYNVDDVAVHLIRSSRAKGYKVDVIRTSPVILELSGWANNNSSSAISASSTTAPQKPPANRGGGNTRGRGRGAVEISMRDVRRGVLSSQLRRKVERIKNL